MKFNYVVNKLRSANFLTTTTISVFLLLVLASCAGCADDNSTPPVEGICMLGYQDISGICVGDSTASCNRFGPDYVFNPDTKKCEGGNGSCPLEGCEISGEFCSCEPDQSCPNEQCFLNEAFFQCSCPPTGDCDQDGDLHLSNDIDCGGDDCDDGDPSSFPGATEICGDNVDQDCSGADLPAELCDNDADGYTPGDNDCDDYNPDINPGVEEIRYNGIDEDCQLYLTPDDDIDGDGYCVNPQFWPHSDEHPENANVCQFYKADGVLLKDCNDADIEVNPGMEEIPCDAIDNDCSGSDFNDQDGDGYHCITEDGGNDCDDKDPLIHPNADERYLNFKDDDCDINDFCIRQSVPRINPECEIVEGVIVSPHGKDLCDFDNDNYYPLDVNASYAAEWCPIENEPGDCDDNDAVINPDTPELLHDGKDNDCNCDTPDDDQDNDGYCVHPENYPDGIGSLYCGVICEVPDEIDCYDEPDSQGANFNPGAIEVAYDGLDQNCDGVDLLDIDDDGFAAKIIGYCFWPYPDETTCSTVQTCISNSLLHSCDCDDGNADINPDAEDDTTDFVDDNCDGVFGEAPDSDGDTWGNNIDCGANDPEIYPHHEEGFGNFDCNNIDENCDGNAVDADCDDFDDVIADSFGRLDCDDSHATVYPGAPQVCGDELANDCDFPDYNICNEGTIDVDGDEFATDGTPADCDDTDPEINPAQHEIAYDGVDNDCSTGGDYDLCDLDGDSFFPDEVVDPLKCPPGTDAGDCNDDNPNVFPDAPEICNDRVKNNCLGASMICNCGDEPHDCVDRDNDEYSPDYDTVDDRVINDVEFDPDCNDLPENNGTYITPNTTEIVYDGIDNDCDLATIDDDLDGDGFLVLAADMSDFDCDDNNDQINPTQADTYGSHSDDDCSVERIDYEANFYFFKTGSEIRRIIPYDINDDGLDDIIAIESGEHSIVNYFADEFGTTNLWSYSFPNYDEWPIIKNEPRDALLGDFDFADPSLDLIVCSVQGYGGSYMFSSVDTFRGVSGSLQLTYDYPSDYADHPYNFNRYDVFDNLAINPIAITQGDFDNDGRPDVATVNSQTDNISILFGQGPSNPVHSSLTYELDASPGYIYPIDPDSLEATFNAGDIVSGDFNGDGFTDLAASGLNFGKLVLLPGKDAIDRTDLFGPTVTTPVYGGLYEMVAIDLDEDGQDEIVAADISQSSVRVFGLGTGNYFREIYNSGTLDLLDAEDSTIRPQSVMVADLNGDDIYDIAVGTTDPDGVVILLGGGTPFIWNEDFEILKDASDNTELFQIGINPRSLDHADYNGDDVDDLLVALFDYGGFAISMANTTGSPAVGDGTFGQATFMETGSRTNHIVSADFSGDQIPDLAITNVDEESISLLFGESTPGCIVGCPTGAFEIAKTIQLGQIPEEIVVGSINNDNIPDLITANPDSGSISILLANSVTGSPNGAFSLPYTFSLFTRPKSMAIADYDDDGLTDIAVVDEEEQFLSILHGSASSLLGGIRTNYTTPSEHPVKVRSLDADNDGAPDLAVVNCPPASAPSHLDIYLNDGSGTFIVPDIETWYAQHLLSGYCNTDLITGDFNEDGLDDLVSSQLEFGKVYLYRSNGDGTFETSYIQTLQGQTDLVSGDFNYDGHLDIAFSSEDLYTVTILLGSGNATFTVAGNFGTGGAPAGLAAGYFNSDRRLDLAVTATLLNGIYLLFNNNE